MSTKRIGLDIDGTITQPETFIPYLNKHFKKNLTLDDIVEYDLTNVLNITKEQMMAWMNEYEPTIYAKAELAPNVEQTLRLWNKKHKLIYITARREHLKDVTTNWFQHRSVPYDHIELVGHHNKIDAVKKHKLDVFFEDKHDNAVAIAEECNIPVVLIDLPYNRLPVPKNVVRVKNWLEAKQWFEQTFHSSSL